METVIPFKAFIVLLLIGHWKPWFTNGFHKCVKVWALESPFLHGVSFSSPVSPCLRRFLNTRAKESVAWCWKLPGARIPRPALSAPLHPSSPSAPRPWVPWASQRGSPTPDPQAKQSKAMQINEKQSKAMQHNAKQCKAKAATKHSKAKQCEIK